MIHCISGEQTNKQQLLEMLYVLRHANLQALVWTWVEEKQILDLLTYNLHIPCYPDSDIFVMPQKQRGSGIHKPGIYA